MNPTPEQLMAEPISRPKKPIPRGPIVIALFFAFAVVMSLFAIYYQARNMHRALAFWGPNDDAPQIRNGSKVELWDVKRRGEAPVTTTSGTRKENGADEVTLTLDGSEWIQSNRRDVSQTQGLLNLRDALLDDFQYDWNQTMRPDQKLEPDHALVFYSGNDNTPSKRNITTVLIDSKNNIICSFRTNRRAFSSKFIDAYLKVFEGPAKPQPAATQNPSQSSD